MVKKPLTVQEKFQQTLLEMDSSLIERTEEIQLALTALLSQHHLLLVGPPGTAKSLVVDSIRRWIGSAKALTIHCCKDTSRNMAFGPVKLSALKEDKTERSLTGGAADCHLLILEEVFKAGPAVLDMFLMLMNERVYKEGLVSAKAPLKFLLGVSNEWSPEGCETALGAFFDRFLYRKEVLPIQTEVGINKLLSIPTPGKVTKRDHSPRFSTTITLEEIDQAHQETLQIPFAEAAVKAFHLIRKELADNGILAGDRRLKQSISACQAFAYLNGSDFVQPDHLEILSNVLWTDPGSAKKTAQIVLRTSNPIGFTVNEKLRLATEVIKVNAPGDTVEKLKEIVKDLTALGRDDRVQQAVNYLDQEIKHAYDRKLGISRS